MNRKRHLFLWQVVYELKITETRTWITGHAQKYFHFPVKKHIRPLEGIPAGG